MGLGSKPGMPAAARVISGVLALVLTVGLAAVGGCGGGGGGVMKKANAGAPPGTGFVTRTLPSDGRKYTVYIPRNYSSQPKWPAIVFLHGRFEGGSNGTSNVGVGLGPAIVNYPGEFPFIAIFPQSRSGDWNEDSTDAAAAIAILDDVSRNYAVDTDRVTLTGLSTGGYGAWALGGKYNDRFAALVPMCGYSAEHMVPRLRGMPIWVFHNAADWAVGSGNSDSMVKKLKEQGDNPRYSKFPGVGHDVWLRAYKDPELFQWMLAQRKSARVAAR